MSNAHRRSKLRREFEQAANGQRPIAIAGGSDGPTAGKNGHTQPPGRGNGHEPSGVGGAVGRPQGNPVVPTPAATRSQGGPVLPTPSAPPSRGEDHAPPHTTGSTGTNGGRHPTQRTPTPPGELTPLLDSLRDLFSRDRQFGARGDAARCGICYLMYPREELIYHEEGGFYACHACEAQLGRTTLQMIHRQRK